MKLIHFCLAVSLSAGLSLTANAEVLVDIIKNPYGGSRNLPELSTNPDYIHAAGLERLVGEWGGELLRPVDVLDPAEVPGHDLAVPDGPSSDDLAAALAWMFENPRTAALGIASTPSFNLDPGGVSRQAALNLIEGAIKGAQAR